MTSDGGGTDVKPRFRYISIGASNIIFNATIAPKSESWVCCNRNAVALPIFLSQHARVRAPHQSISCGGSSLESASFNQYFDRDIYLPEYNLREVLTVSTQPVDSSTQWSAS